MSGTEPFAGCGCPDADILALNQPIALRAFAKINLGLKILGKRPDGYHELRTIYQTVALHDRLEISLTKARRGIHLECDGLLVPSGRDNLVYRACELWQRAREFRDGIHVCLEKRIPAGSGLGGASADAAATLLGLERLAGDRLAPPSRFKLAASLGSDAPLFLWGGRVLGLGRGEEVYPLADLPPRKCLIVFPGFAISTAEAYRELSLRLTKGRRESNIYSFGAWSHFPQEGWGPAENDFEQVVFARWPELAGLKASLIRAGAEAASLTGSGSAVYAVFDSAQKVRGAARFIPQGWKTFRTRTLSRAEYHRLLFVPCGEGSDE
jgi:4-diphosphocytidyl-2-C-methyl-D-erythritol kinase